MTLTVLDAQLIRERRDGQGGVGSSLTKRGVWLHGHGGDNMCMYMWSQGGYVVTTWWLRTCR